MKRIGISYLKYMQDGYKNINALPELIINRCVKWMPGIWPISDAVTHITHTFLLPMVKWLPLGIKVWTKCHGFQNDNKYLRVNGFWK